MGGSGSGGTFVGRTPDELRDIVRKEEDKAKGSIFETQLASILGDLLGVFNSRDTETVRDRLDEIKSIMRESIDGTFDQILGGSVAKHTYVDGLSDIDSLVLLNDSDLEKTKPQRALAKLEKLIGRSLKGAQVSYGRMAVTVEYPDGMVIQLLPAIKADDGRVLVPSSRRDGWSKINPITFQQALTQRNQECGGKLVPTIKLAKAIIGQLPDEQRLAGYHIESLAIAAFRGYDGPKTTSAMLPTFFERAKKLVLTPIKDSTGQSVHVDEYLGPANSEQRKTTSHLLGRLERRMRNATAAASVPQWRALFDLE